MSDLASILNELKDAAARRGETLEQASRHRVLKGLIARVARTAGDAFVLRGGMLTRAWVAPLPRPTTDLDYVGDFPFDVEDTARRLRPALEQDLDDGVRCDPGSLEARGIWLDTAFPGVRVQVRAGIGSPDDAVTLDVGFADPLVPETTRLELAGVRVRCVRPETQVAWKLHALAEMGASFRPKDLADLWRITTRTALDADALPPAIDAAFTSRGYSLDDARNVLVQAHWGTKSARVRWNPDRTGAGVPPLPEALADVRERLAPALEALGRR